MKAPDSHQTIVIIVVNIFSLTAILATASRMLWAFARENGLPASGFISHVSIDTVSLKSAAY